ncbi:CILP2 [Branchiostoma lanceolatum]|uniref:CILP2 protein n=1 Tax=Branchiostoma lanceolatum TaxID=7740 RepID=A0A8J9ZDP7_BRALA|nr:CILP2 [Branchiostoma lanceolatum]
MSDGYEEPWRPSGASECLTGHHYEQACDVRPDFADTDDKANDADGRPRTKPPFAARSITAIGLLCALLGLTMVALALRYRGAGNTEAIHVAMNEKTVTSVSMVTNMNGISVDGVITDIHDVITDMRSSVPEQMSPELTDTTKDDVTTLKLGATTSLSTIAPLNITEEPPAGCPAWTRWYDRDDPHDYGDWESLVSIRRDLENPGELCFGPSDMQARVKGSNVSALQTGQKFLFLKPILGLVCRGRDQGGQRLCHDYEVRFCCPPY